MTVLNNKNLKTILEKRISEAMKLTRDEIYTVVQKNIQKYYDEYSPKAYSRTYKFLNSLIKTKIKNENGTLKCSVEIDRAFLNATYKGDATGYDVASWANQKSHGGYINEDFNIEFWNDALEELGGETGIKKIFKRNFIKCGIPLH